MKKIIITFVAALVLIIGMVVLLLASSKRERPAPPVAERPLPAMLKDPVFTADLNSSRRRGPGGIAIVAPASGLKGESVRRVHEYAEALGVRFRDDALAPETVPYTANSDEQRLEQLYQAMTDDNTEVLWAMRGGYGVSRILPELDRLPKPKSPKLFVGYSDMTFLHLFLRKWNWKTIHGGMLWELGSPEKDPESFRLLSGLLSGRIWELRYEGLKPFNRAADDQKDPLEAPITGGNLTCIAAAAGTPWALDAANRILLLEDTKERGYKIDRMLTQLRQAGQLQGVRAVILGNFSAGDDQLEFALERFAGECEAPVFRTDLFGHGPKNHPVVFNTPASLIRNDGDGSFTLVIETGMLP